MAANLPLPVAQWFDCWNSGDIDNLPLTDDFRHKSPFGTIETKTRYLEIVNKNRDSFLGNRLTVLKQIVDGNNWPYLDDRLVRVISPATDPGWMLAFCPE